MARSGTTDEAQRAWYSPLVKSSTSIPQVKIENMKKSTAQFHRFFDLPMELRMKIYGYALVKQEGLFGYCGRWEGPQYQNGIWPAILQTCKQVHEEARELLYTQNRFYFDSTRLLTELTLRTEAYNYTMIRYINFKQTERSPPTSRSVARDLGYWLNILVTFRNLRSVTFTVPYQMQINEAVWELWDGTNPKELGTWASWNNEQLLILGTAFADWHRGLRLNSISSKVEKAKQKNMINKTSTFQWLDAGPEKKKSQVKVWPFIDYRTLDWEAIAGDWMYFVRTRLPVKHECELQDLEWPPANKVKPWNRTELVDTI